MNSSENKNIAVQFVPRAKRNAVLKKAGKIWFKGRNAGLSTSTTFYINEHICPELKRLLGIPTAKIREAGWSYVSVRNGQIFVRKTDASAVVVIACEDDL